MRIILVRHAIAEDRDDTRWPEDDARPLSACGRQRFEAVARGLRALAPSVDAVLSSPYARAWETAELLHDVAGWPTPQTCAALIDADLEAIGHALAQLSGSVALVGHEPGLSALASWLLFGPAADAGLAFRKGGAACFDVERWAPASAVLLWVASPKQARTLAAGAAPPPVDHLEAIAHPIHAAASTATRPAPTTDA